MAKPFWQSKVFWANTLGIAASVLGQVSGVVSPQYQPVLIAVVGGINLFLRVIDPDKPITLS